MGKASKISIFAEKIPGYSKYEKFQHMINYGYGKEEVQKELNISTKTYNIYMNRLEYSVDTYLHHLAKIGYVSNMNSILQQIAKNTHIQALLRDTALKAVDKDPLDTKAISIASQANMALNKMLNESFVMQGGAPLASAFRQFIKKNVIEKDRTQGDNSNNKYNLPVLPSDT